MAKDIIGQYEESFNQTKIGKDLNKKLSVILDKMEESRLKEKEERVAEVFKVMENRRNGKISEREESEQIRLLTINIMSKYEDSNRKLLRESISVKNEIQDAIGNYAKKCESNNAWNNLVRRKATPKLLESMLNRNGATEMQMELDLHGCLSESGKQNRFCFPIESMETLGWIKRVGSGTIGDAKVCSLTDEGKRQLDFYNKYKTFDGSNIE